MRPEARRTRRGFLVLECAQVLPVLTTSGGKTPTFSPPERALPLSRSCPCRVPWQVSECQPCGAWGLPRSRTSCSRRASCSPTGQPRGERSLARSPPPADRGPERRDLRVRIPARPESPPVSTLCRLGGGTAAWWARSALLGPPGWGRIFPACWEEHAGNQEHGLRDPADPNPHAGLTEAMPSLL